MFNILLTIILFSLVLFFLKVCAKRACPAKSLYFKMPVLDKNKIDPSFVLLSPFSNKENLDIKGQVYLLDLFGKVVHKWETDHQAFFATLKKNGHILVSSVLPKTRKNYPGGGKAGHICEYDWNGEKIWEYENEAMHHDAEILPNGNIVTIVCAKTPKEFGEKVRGGMPDSDFEEKVWSDSLIEIEKGKIVWRWNAWEHLDPEDFRLNEFIPRAEFTHINSVRFLEKNPLDQSEAFLISMRHLNMVTIIRKSDGKIIWKSPPEMLAFQHDATYLPSGNILVFDNGTFRKNGKRASFLWSRVVEIDPKKNEIVWHFNGGETGQEKARFAAGLLGGAQRLQNGNTMIVDGIRGHLFELTPEKEVVWDFFSPYLAFRTGVWPNNTVFRARRYHPKEIDWPEKIAKPLPLLTYFLKKIGF